MSLIFHQFFKFFTRIRFLESLYYNNNILYTMNNISKYLIRNLNLISKSVENKKKFVSLKSNKIPADSVAVMIPLIPAILLSFSRRFPSPNLSRAFLLFSFLRSILVSPSLSFILFSSFFSFIFPLVAHGVCSRRVTTPLERAARKIFLRRDSHFSRLTVVEGREITVAHLYGICSLPARRALPRSLSRWVAEE